MKHITVYVDFISPYAYLAFEQLPKVLQGTSYSASYRPVLFAGLLAHHGQLGPAEIAAKRDWTYRHVLWLAHSLGIAMQMPSSHPFNPLALLRLAIACSREVAAGPGGEVNRYVCESIFQHVWRSRLAADDRNRFESLAANLRPAHDITSAAVKNRLRQNTSDAIVQGVFGVPTFAVDDKVFWGLDALPFLRDYLVGGDWFADDRWQSAGHVLVGATRVRHQ